MIMRPVKMAMRFRIVKAYGDYMYIPLSYTCINLCITPCAVLAIERTMALGLGALFLRAFDAKSWRASAFCFRRSPSQCAFAENVRSTCETVP